MQLSSGEIPPATTPPAAGVPSDNATLIIETMHDYMQILKRLLEVSVLISESSARGNKRTLGVGIGRRNVDENLPCGADALVEHLVRISKRSLLFRQSLYSADWIARR